MKKFPKIIFMGSNKFSLSTLKELYNKKYNIIGIITIPDHKKNFSPVKKYALEKKIPFLQPKNLSDNKFLEKIKIWNADIQIVVSFRILPKVVWIYPKLGTINLHPSLLPQYKGAAPINWVIINGEKKTGITVFFIEEKIDSGKIILQQEINIKENETAGQLQNRLEYISKYIIVNSLNKILNNDNIYCKKNIYSYPLKYAPKIFKKNCRIKWNKSVNSIYNKIRGLSPIPTAWTFLFINSKPFRFKIFLAKKKIKNHIFPIGKVIIDIDNILISVKEGFIYIIECQIEGKKKMNVKNFINGIKKRKNIFVE
ncbi:methionyl-tRNA formyltransferase [Blattabacterium cuenoti]|uniref:methionyl-tRNA formyltransferase n=1 Tax=Blattabacterium cuenoti TaxID=1653831 RepID=UPI00163C7451|nr:methionyl-tRNA formyltransferase [Blattabacterium cuenoti]